MEFGKLIEEVWGEKPEYQHVVELFVGPLYRDKQRRKGHQDYRAFLRDVRNGIGEKDFDIAVLVRGAKLASDDRSNMPTRPEALGYCEQAKAELAAERRTYQAARTETLKRQADPIMAALTDELRNQLRSREGKLVFESWFAGIQCERLDGTVLTASVPEKFKKKWIDSNYADQLRACASAVCVGLTSVKVVAREQG